jgi:hypothetical protein
VGTGFPKDHAQLRNPDAQQSIFAGAIRVKRALQQAAKLIIIRDNRKIRMGAARGQIAVEFQDRR